MIPTEPILGRSEAAAYEGEGFCRISYKEELFAHADEYPMGAGVKYFFSENLNVSFEVIHRKTFTDYIDDVSTTYVDPTLFSNILHRAGCHGCEIVEQEREWL